MKRFIIIFIFLPFLSCLPNRYNYGTGYYAPCWSADGTKIYFFRNDLTVKEISNVVVHTWEYEKNECYICSCNPDGSDLKGIIKVGEIPNEIKGLTDEFDVSDKGEIIYSTSYYSSDITAKIITIKSGIWSVKDDGSNDHQLLGWGRNPRWTYHYSKIIFEGTDDNSGIWLMDKDGSNVTQLLAEGSSPSFCDTTEELLYHKRGWIWIYSFIDSSSDSITEGSYGDISPDGNEFAYFSYGRLKIYNMSDSVTITVCGGNKPRWSKNSEKILINEFENIGDVGIVNNDGSSLHKILDGDSWPYHN
ncbi:MAG: hypothetical protein PHE49_10470 [bacterium]|nr:hypothetical protein [bacterium]